MLGKYIFSRKRVRNKERKTLWFHKKKDREFKVLIAQNKANRSGVMQNFEGRNEDVEDEGK